MIPTHLTTCPCGYSRTHSTLVLDVEARTELQAHNLKCDRAHAQVTKRLTATYPTASKETR